MARTKLPFLATIKYPGGSYEVEVLERGLRFVRWLGRADGRGCSGVEQAG